MVFKHGGNQSFTFFVNEAFSYLLWISLCLILHMRKQFKQIVGVKLKRTLVIAWEKQYTSRNF